MPTKSELEKEVIELKEQIAKLSKQASSGAKEPLLGVETNYRGARAFIITETDYARLGGV